MELEFIEEPPVPDGSDDDVLETGHEHSRRPWLVGGALLAVAAVALFVVTRHDPSSRPTAATTSSPSAVASQSSPPDSVRNSLDETAVAVYERALDSTPTQDVLRTGSNATSCTGVRIGAVPPQTVAARLLTGALRGYHTVDAARIIDQNAGLCALQVRVRNPAGTAAVLLVTSPTPGLAPDPTPNTVRDGRAVFGPATVSYVVFRTGAGWAVTVGAVGSGRDLPRSQLLAELATDPRLRW